MVESGSFWSFGLLDGLSGKYCDISFMVGIMAEKQGQHQEMDICHGDVQISADYLIRRLAS